tara:strand:+ start:476 stop:709 length:234 start_codon:yes stop_codon:yes gene_type:complete
MKKKHKGLGPKAKPMMKGGIMKMAMGGGASARRSRQGAETAKSGVKKMAMGGAKSGVKKLGRGGGLKKMGRGGKLKK